MKIKKNYHILKNSIINKIKYLQFRLDTTRFIFDKPKFDYQPLPWVGINKAIIRGQASYKRWEAIKNYIGEYKSLKDIGCCVGFFCHKSAENYDMNVIGIDTNERFLRIAEFTKQHVKNGQKEIFYNMTVNENNVDILPQTDVTILFSIWHHWAFHYGLDKATQIIKTIWSKTNHVLLFESGEEEIKEKFNLPFDKKASKWLKEYLSNNLDGVQINVLGDFEVGDYKDYKLKGHKRTVFALIKNS